LGQKTVEPFPQDLYNSLDETIFSPSPVPAMNAPNLSRKRQPAVRSGFDFAEMPLASAQTVLRDLAVALVGEALGEKRADYLALAAWQWRPHRQLPGFRLVRLPSLATLRPRIWLSRMRDRLVLGRAARGQRARWKVRIRRGSHHPGAQPRYRHLSKLALSGKVTHRARHRLMVWESARSFYEGDSFMLPPSLWRLAGALAWATPKFQLKIAAKIRNYLRARTVFQPGNLPHAELTPRVFWLLLAMATPPRASIWQRLQPKRRRMATNLRRLKQIAAHFALSEGWATSWDQWLVAMWLKRNPNWWSALEDPLRGAVASLPLLRKLTLTAAPSGETSAATPRLVATADDRQVDLDWLIPFWETQTQEEAIHVRS
jgi:hypothetical protein